jgi:predicted transcriptional regulator
MSKKQEIADKMNAFGDKLTSKESALAQPPIQTVVDEKEAIKAKSIDKKTGKQVPAKEEETAFHVFIPSDTLWKVKEIGVKQRKKIKEIFVEALNEYVKKHEAK